MANEENITGDYGDAPRRPRRPRRSDRGRDDDFDDVPERRRKLSGLEAFYADNLVLVVLLGLCCGKVALILGIIGLVSFKDETARKHAIISLVLPIAVVAVLMFFYVVLIAIGGLK